MLRRLLLVLSTLSVVLSVQSRPAAEPEEPHRLHTRSKSGEPFSPVIVPLGEPAMLLGRQYQVVKREPTPLIIMSPAFETAIGQPKGEKPPAPVPTVSKRAFMPRYVAQRENQENNYLSNVGPGPVYPSYLPYEAPKAETPTSTSSAVAPSATSGAKAQSEDVKKEEHAGQKGKAKGKESKKHKSG